MSELSSIFSGFEEGMISLKAFNLFSVIPPIFNNSSFDMFFICSIVFTFTTFKSSSVLESIPALANSVFGSLPETSDVLFSDEMSTFQPHSFAANLTF